MTGTLAKYVKPRKYEEASGYTVEAIETKIKRGVWLEGHEYIRAPDGNILISIEGVELWAEGRRVVGSGPRVTGSR